jgi:hypothetical protein
VPGRWSKQYLAKVLPVAALKVRQKAFWLMQQASAASATLIGS